jgi:hypothetical protein
METRASDEEVLEVFRGWVQSADGRIPDWMLENAGMWAGARLFIEQRKADARAASANDPRSAREAARALFTGTQCRLLGLLFGQPERYFHVNELMRRSGCGSGAVQRELARLLGCGLLECERFRGRRLFRASRDTPLYAELVGVFRKAALAAALREALVPYERQVEAAFVYDWEPVHSRGPPSLHLLVVADGLDLTTLEAALAPVGAELGRQCNVQLFPGAVVRCSSEERGWFLGRIVAQRLVWVLGDEEWLKACGPN